MKVYLSGGIFQLPDSECRGWRDVATESLNRYGIDTLDPMRRDYRGRESREVADEIVRQDLADIDASDALLVNGIRPSWGTAMEVFYAFRRQKPKLIHVAVFNVFDPLSPWLYFHSSSVHATMTNAILELVGIKYREDHP